MGSQKFIGRNRPPRVHIVYDVDRDGAEKTVELPFVMGVMADLAGKPQEGEEVVPFKDRKLKEFDAENFDKRMKAMKPRAAFRVPNKLTGEGEMSVDISFEDMDDFSPAAVAGKVAGVKELLEARSQLDNLLAYMSGKDGAENLIEKLIQDKSLQEALSAGVKDVDQAAEPQEEGEE